MSAIDNILELKTYITLMGNKRLPEYESEIFADEELTIFYLHNLCKDLEWYEGDEENSALVYYYAFFVIDDRWPEAERIITVAFFAYQYARNVICARWPEAEYTIIADPAYAYYYASDVIMDRWPEAEHVIKSDDLYWRVYRRDFGIIDE